jgi:hypothetical protein
MTKTRAILLLALACVLGLPYGQVAAQYASQSPPPVVSGVAAESLRQPDRWMALPVKRQVEERRELGRLLESGQEAEIAALPRIVTFSDPHGALDRLDGLLLHALGSVPAGAPLNTLERFEPEAALAPQLEAKGVRLADFRGQIFFHNLGDLIDRGPRGVAVYRRTRELMDAKLADFVIGNHDFWMFMNLQGLHLPSYAGFDFYNYSDEFDGRYGRVEQVVAAQREKIAEASQADWWARKFAELTLRHEADQKSRWRAVQDKANALFKAMTEGMSRDDVMRFGATPEGRLWNSLRGYDVRVGDVYVGVRAVAGSSLRWWQDLLAEFSTAGAALREDAPHRELWRGAIQLIAQDIIPPLRADIEAALERGEWWVRAFEAINYRNYDSPEWWAKDWIFHKDWGTATLKEISPEFKEDRLDAPVSFANYLRQPMLAEMADFFRANFTLYRSDMYGTVVMHGLLPVDAATGEFVFSYKGQEYRGRGGNGRGGKTPSVWEGLRRIETDIRDTQKPLAQLHEAFALVNSWYADRTTAAKAIDVARAVNRIGSDRLAEANGFGRLYLGHVTFLEFISHLTAEQRGERIRGFLIDNRIGLVDHGMSARYGHRGAYITTTPQDGITLVGFEHGQSTRPLANPRTRKDSGKDGSEGASLAEHPGMPATAFRAQLQREIAADQRAQQ